MPRLATGAWLTAGPLVLAALAAAAWPVTLYAEAPWLLPALVLGAGATVLIWQRPAWGVAIILGLLPLLQAQIGGGGFDKPFKLLIGGLIVGTAMVVVVQGHRPGRMGAVLGLVLAALAFAAATVGSALVGSDPGAAPSASVYLGLGLLLFLATMQVASSRADLMLVLGGAVVGLFVAGAEGVGQHFAGYDGRYGFWSGSEWVVRVEGSFGHPSLFAAYLMVSIPVAAAITLAREAPRPLRLFAAGAASLALPALYFSYTRGAILALGIGTLIWLAVVRPRIAAAAAVAALAAALALAPSALGDRFSTYRNTQSDAALLLRQGAWDGALAIFSERPLTGAGVGAFPRAYAGIPDDVLPSASTPLFYDQLRTDAQPWHAHNVYLTILAEGGVLGFVAFALLAAAILTTVRRGTRVAEPAAGVVCIGIGCAVMAWAVHGTVDFDTYWVSLSLFAFIGVAAAQVARHESSRGRWTAEPAHRA